MLKPQEIKDAEGKVWEELTAQHKVITLKIWQQLNKLSEDFLKC